MALKWKLRQVMASREIWSGAELGRLMEHKAGYKLSSPAISALLTEEPKQVKGLTMDALCTALDCGPSDLWEHTPSIIKTPSIESEKIELKKTANKKISKRVPPPI
ncbi:MAG TPA: helix-turn-helix transcriptional regulator [Rickettsiales bacterium]|nr:helix-turn-helix transcriptional regulator [Rickettsiales bacterium]